MLYPGTFSETAGFPITFINFAHQHKLNCLLIISLSRFVSSILTFGSKMNQTVFLFTFSLLTNRILENRNDDYYVAAGIALLRIILTEQTLLSNLIKMKTVINKIVYLYILNCLIKQRNCFISRVVQAGN